jgi:hypothetical protein
LVFSGQENVFKRSGSRYHCRKYSMNTLFRNLIH